MTSKDFQQNSNLIEDVAEERAADAEELPLVGAGLSEDPTAQLREEIEAAKAESEQWKDRCLRKAAELDNFRKRTEKERSELVLTAGCSLLVEFLPIVDACERAIESFRNAPVEQPGLEQYREGVELLYKQLNDALARVGVVRIEALGKTFDPHLHEAMMREQTTEHEENTVIRQLRQGYLFKERLLRPAQVAVASLPPHKD